MEKKISSNNPEDNKFLELPDKGSQRKNDDTNATESNFSISRASVGENSVEN